MNKHKISLHSVSGILACLLLASFLILVGGKTNPVVIKVKNNVNGAQEWRSKNPDIRISIKFVFGSPGKKV